MKHPMQIIIRIFLALGMLLTILFSGAFGYNKQFIAIAFGCELVLVIPYLLLILLFRITWNELFDHLMILLACIIIPTITLPHDLLDKAPFEFEWFVSIFIGICLVGVWILGLLAQIISALCHRQKTEVHGFQVIMKNPKDNP